MTDFDPDEFLAAMRERSAAASARADAALARLDVETRPRRSAERFSCSGPLAFLFDGEHPDDVIRTAASFKKIMRVFKKIGPRRQWSPNSTTTVTLAGGKRFRFDFSTGEVTKP